MTKSRSIKAAFLTAACVIAVIAPAAAQTPAEFYNGKTVHIVVGFGSGGGYDLYGRMLGRYLGKYIPGHPNVVVENMTGAGSVRAANHVYAVAPQDGTYIAAVNQNMPMYQLLGGDGAKFKASGMQWLGSMANSNGLVYTWKASGIATLDDAKKRDVPLGAAGTSSDSYIYPTLINDLLGTRFKPINGYTGSGQINIAIERGEVMGRGGNSWASVQTGNKTWLEQKKINLLVQVGFKKEPELPDVPLLLDLVKTDDARAVVRVISQPPAIGYGHWVGPGVPKDRIDALRAAYAETMKDPDLLKEAEKINMLIRPQNGVDVEGLVKQAAGAPQAVLSRTAKILGWK